MIAKRKIRLRNLSYRLLMSMVLGFLLLINNFSLKAQFSQDWDLFYGSNNFDELLSVVELDDGYVFGGSATSSTMGDSPQTAGSSDYWIYKTDFEGNILWNFTYGGFGIDNLQNLIQTDDGGFIMCGFSFSNTGAFKSQDSRGDRDFWIVKVDENGLFTWDLTVGGDQEEFPTTIVQLQDGSYFVGGWTQSLVSGEVSTPTRGGMFDYWLAHIDPNGVFLNDHRLGGANADQLFDIYELPDGDILLSGLSSSNIGGEKSEDRYGGFDAWVIRMNINGNIVWDRTYGGAQNEQGWSIAMAPDGNILIGGFSDSGISGNKTTPNIGGADYWLIKIDEAGNKIYDRTFGGAQSDEVNELKVNEKGLYYLGGRSQSGIGADKSESNRGNWDYWLIIVDDDGNVFYDKTLGGDDIDNLSDFEILDTGGILCAGFTASDTSGDITDVSNGINDNWVVVLECTLDQFLDIGEDQMVCEFTSQVLSANTNQPNICSTIWNDGDTEVDRNFFIDEDESFSVMVKNIYGCVAEDTIDFTIFDAPEFDLGAPLISLCIGEDTLVTTGLNELNNTFLWDDNSTDSERVLVTPGSYELTVTDLVGCTFADTIRIENYAQPTADLGPDLTFCEGEINSISVSDSGPTYIWSEPNANVPSLTINESGTYSVTVTNEDDCSSEDSIVVIVNDRPDMNLGADMVICEGEIVMLDATALACPTCAYEWEDMSTNPMRDVSPFFNTTYTVVVTDTDNMCTRQDGLTVSVLPRSIIRVNDLTCNPAEVRNDTVIGTNQFGCDSLTIFNIVGLPSDTLRSSIGVCDSLDVGVDTIVGVNIFDCDSLNIISSFLLPSTLENISGGTCDIEEVGIDTMVFENEFGCDSTIIQELILLPSTEFTFEFVSCDPDEVGVDTMILTNEFGCDSTIITVVRQILSDTIRLNESVCLDNEVGMDTLILTNDVGCDSLIITNFFKVLSDTIVSIDFTCDPMEVRNDTVFIQNQFGCDSLIVDIVNQAPSTEEDVLIMTCDVNQVARDTIFEINIFGCDSIIYQNFQLLRSDTVILQDFVCDASAFVDTSFLINSLGCDSLVITEFEEARSDEIMLDGFTCDENQVGIQVFNLVNQFGCDSIVTIDFDLVEMQVTVFEENTCDPSQFMPDTLIFPTDQCDSLVIINYNVQLENETIVPLVSCDMNDVGTSTNVFTNQFGCDSTVISVVEFAEEDITNLTEFECGQVDTLIQEALFTNQFGCDSIVITTTLPGLDTTLNLSTVCEEGELFEMETVFTSVDGCDSIVIDRGMLSDNFETVFDIFTCDENMVGSTSLNFTSVEGCDSIIIFNTLLGEIEIVQDVRNIACGETATGEITVQGNAGQLPYLYNIDGGAFSPQRVFENLEIGVYQIGVQDADGCESFIEAEITEVTGVDIEELPDFVELDFGDPLILDPIINGEFTEFFWTGVDSLICETCLGQNYVPLTSGTLTFSVISIEGCRERHQVLIAVVKNYDVFIPNAFSPNDDSINDFFTVFGGDNVTSIRNLSLYSRWGELVFEREDFLPSVESSGWDGRLRGEPMSPGVFVYKARVEFFDGTIEEFEGDFSLIR